MASQDRERPRLRKPDTRARQSYPPRRFDKYAWINHVLGYTMEQWVLFDPHAGGGTRISTWVEFTGAALMVDGHDIEAIVRRFVETWYTNFAAECDRMATWV